jgi:tetratricopeptide (TPR) repeat protein
MIQLGDEGEFVLIHRLVQELLRRSIPEGWSALWLSCAMGLIDAAGPTDESDDRTWLVWGSVRPHVEAVLVAADRAGLDAEPITHLTYQLAMYLHATARYAEAEALLRRLIHVMGEGDPRLGAVFGVLGGVQRATHKFDEAESSMRRSLALHERRLGPDHADVARDLANLAAVLYDVARFGEAETAIRRALKINEALLGPEPRGYQP